MPTVKDKQTGDVVSRQPYTSEGTQRAEQIAESDPNWEITNAPDTRENYQLGGQVPGQPGFGQRPPVVAPGVPPSPEGFKLGDAIPISSKANPMWDTTTTINPPFEKGGKVDDKPTNDDLGILEYKKGGKAKKK